MRGCMNINEVYQLNYEMKQPQLLQRVLDLLFYPVQTVETQDILCFYCWL